jgi:hypothetical protein
MLLILFALWSVLFLGVPWCLGVNGPKFGPKILSLDNAAFR